MLAPLLKRILSLRPTDTNVSGLVGTGPGGKCVELLWRQHVGSPGKIGNTILPMRPERILATPDSPMEMGPCNAEAIAVSRILGTPEIPPRTIACHTCCETLRRPPNWLATARELALRRCMLQENGDQIVEDFLHNLGPVRHREEDRTRERPTENSRGAEHHRARRRVGAQSLRGGRGLRSDLLEGPRGSGIGCATHKK